MRETDCDNVVLLIHGLFGNPLEMQYLARQLRRAGFATETPHFPGYGFDGRSDPMAGGSWQEWRALVLERFDHLLRNYRSVSVAGLCIGAVLALDLAVERPGKVSALALLGTTLFYDGWSLPWYQFLAPLAYYTPLRRFYPSYQERHPYGVKNEALRKWIAREMSEKTTSVAGASSLPMAAVHEARKLIRQVKKTLPQVTAPALVVHAEEDDVASVRSAEHVLDRIGSDDVDFILLRDSYHIVTLDNEKDRVAGETTRFFRDRTKASTVAPAESVPKTRASAA